MGFRKFVDIEGVLFSIYGCVIYEYCKFEVILEPGIYPDEEPGIWYGNKILQNTNEYDLMVITNVFVNEQRCFFLI